MQTSYVPILSPTNPTQNHGPPLLYTRFHFSLPEIGLVYKETRRSIYFSVVPIGRTIITRNNAYLLLVGRIGKVYELSNVDSSKGQEEISTELSSTVAVRGWSRRRRLYSTHPTDMLSLYLRIQTRVG
jgi:hypothetical protein